MEFFEAHGALYWLLVLGTLGAAAVVEWGRRQWQQTVEQCSDLPAGCGLTGGAVAQRLLGAGGMSDVAVVRTDKADRYDPHTREVRLTKHTFDEAGIPRCPVGARASPAAAPRTRFGLGELQ